MHLASQRIAYRDLVPPAVIEHPDLAQRTRDWSSTLSASAGPTLLLEDQGGLLGFCYVRPTVDEDLDPGVQAEIANLHVAPQLRSRGHGTVLFDAARVWATEEGRLRELTLWVLEENRQARRFYERRGMTPDGGRRRYHGSSVPVIRYRMAL